VSFRNCRSHTQIPLNPFSSTGLQTCITAWPIQANGPGVETWEGVFGTKHGPVVCDRPALEENGTEALRLGYLPAAANQAETHQSGAEQHDGAGLGSGA